MATKDTNVRLQLTISKKVADRLDSFCETSGMTRSQYVTYILATSLDSYGRLNEAAADSIRAAAKTES